MTVECRLELLFNKPGYWNIIKNYVYNNAVDTTNNKYNNATTVTGPV